MAEQIRFLIGLSEESMQTVPFSFSSEFKSFTNIMWNIFYHVVK